MTIIYGKKELCIRLCLLAVLFLLLLSLCLTVWRQALCFIPVGTEFTGAGISFETLERIAPENPELVIGGRQDLPCIIDTALTGGYSGTGTLCLVNESYFSFINLTFVAGDLSGLFAGQHDSAPVMIGADLARRLFFTLDCIGSKISVNDQLFTVAGVYEEPQSVLHRISSDGKDVLYAPYCTAAREAEANHIFVRPKDGETVREEAVSRLNASLGGKLERYAPRDLTNMRGSLTQLMRFAVLMLGVVAMVSLARVFLVSFRKFLAWRREATRAYAVTGRSAARKLLLPIACAMAFIAVALLVRFPFIIPAYFFPEGNRLFDLNHYLDVFINGFINRNVAAYSYVESVYNYGIWMINIASILMVWVFASLISLLYRVVRIHIK